MDPPSTGLAGMAGADCGSPERDDPRGARDASDSAVGLSDVVAAAPVRSVHQAISCRPEDVRKPARGNSVHRGFAGNADGTTHHGGSHHGYMAFKIQKLAEQNEVVAGRATRREGDPSSSNDARPSGGVFHGVSIHVNGITDPPWIDLKDIMLANGGRFANYYSRVSVTHIVCAGLTAAKLAALKKADRNHPPVVRPAWVTESLKAGKLLPCASFALEGTLEPGQRRIAAFAAPAPARAGADDVNADDGGDTESDPDAEDAPDAAVAPTQERDDEQEDFGLRFREHRGEKLASAAERKKKGEPAPEGSEKKKTHAFLRVAFFAVRDHLEALPPGDEDARASARFAATRAASAAAYAALASMIDADASRLVPVSAWEALVVPSAPGTGNVHLGEEASRLAEALRAAGVDAGAVPATLVYPTGTRDVGGDDLFASVAVSDDADASRDPLLDGERAAKNRVSGGGGPKLSASREKTPRETRKRVRWSSGVDDDGARGTAGEDSAEKKEKKEKKEKRRGTRVALRSPPPRRRPRRTKSTTRRGRLFRRRCATRFWGGRVGRAKTAFFRSLAGYATPPPASLPEAKMSKGRSTPSARTSAYARRSDSRVQARRRRRLRRAPRRSQMTPATTACPRRSRRSTPRSSRRSARRRRARCARTTSAPPGRRPCARGGRARVRARRVGARTPSPPPDKKTPRRFSPRRKRIRTRREEKKTAKRATTGRAAEISRRTRMTTTTTTTTTTKRSRFRRSSTTIAKATTIARRVARKTVPRALNLRRSRWIPRRRRTSRRVRTPRWTRWRRASKPPCTRSSRDAAAITIRPPASRLSTPPRRCSGTRRARSCSTTRWSGRRG